MARYSNPQGFTFVELMIVMAIIAILAAISIPYFEQNRMTAQRTEAEMALSLIHSSQIGEMAGVDYFSSTFAGLGLTQYMAELKYFARPANYLPFASCGLDDICLVPNDGSESYIAVLIADFDKNPENNEYLNDVWLIHHRFPVPTLAGKDSVPYHLFDDLI